MERPECERHRFDDLIPFLNRKMDEAQELAKERDEVRTWICRIARLVEVPCPEEDPGETTKRGWERWMQAIETKLSA